MKRGNIDVVKEISMRKFILSSIHNLSFKGVGQSGREGGGNWRRRGGGVKVLKFDRKPLLQTARRRRTY